MSAIGKERRLRRIFRKNGKTVIVPMDHGVTLGPIRGLVDMQDMVNKLLAGGVDAILVHKGIASRVDSGRAGLIIHASASTRLGQDPLFKTRVCSVEEAIRLGADGVSVHVNVGAPSEPEMLQKLGEVADECDAYGMPLAMPKPVEIRSRLRLRSSDRRIWTRRLMRLPRCPTILWSRAETGGSFRSRTSWPTCKSPLS